MVELDIRELCERAGVTPRTIHYYIQQGLLPPAGATGPGARYSAAHLDRLRLIRLLQKEHLPLAEIGRRLRVLSDEEVRALVRERRTAREPAAESALEYVRSVLRGSERTGGPRHAVMALASLSSRTPAPRQPARSQWERLELDDGIELHVRRPLTREQQRRLERFLAAAKSAFESPDEQS